MPVSGGIRPFEIQFAIVSTISTFLGLSLALVHEIVGLTRGGHSWRSLSRGSLFCGASFCPLLVSHSWAPLIYLLLGPLYLLLPPLNQCWEPLFRLSDTIIIILLSHNNQV